MLSCRTGSASLLEASSRRETMLDDPLIERSCGGDRAAFDQLVERHYTAIHAVARRLGPSPDDAADIAQEVFLAAWRQLGRFHRRASFRTWLHAICVRQCALAARAFRRRPLSLDVEDALEPVAAESVSMETLVASRQQEAALHAAIQALPRAQSEAVALHYFGGLTCAETAMVMGISAGAVMTHLFRARQNLRHALHWLVDEEASR